MLVNPGKSGLFGVPERIEMLAEVTAELGNVGSTRSRGCWSTTAGSAGSRRW